MPNVIPKYEVSDKVDNGYIIDQWGLNKGMEYYYIEKYQKKKEFTLTIGIVKAAGTGAGHGKPLWAAGKEPECQNYSMEILDSGAILIKHTTDKNKVIGVIRPKSVQTDAQAPDATTDTRLKGVQGSPMELALDLMVECWVQVNTRPEFKDLPSEDRRSLAISLFIEMSRKRYG